MAPLPRQSKAVFAWCCAVGGGRGAPNEPSILNWECPVEPLNQYVGVADVRRLLYRAQWPWLSLSCARHSVGAVRKQVVQFWNYGISFLRFGRTEELESQPFVCQTLPARGMRLTAPRKWDDA